MVKTVALATGVLATALTLSACGNTSNASNSSGGSGTGANVAFGTQICGQTAAAPNYSQPFAAIAGASKSLSGAGSTFVAPVMSVWTKNYSSAAGGAQVAYQSIGSGGGVAQIQAKTVDFGASDVGIKDTEIAASKGGAGSIIQFPLVAGADVVTYNLPGIKSGLKFDGPTLGKIYAGEIKKWNDPALTALNPGVKMPNLPIAVVHRSDGSGTTGIWTHYLTQVSPDWVTKLGGATQSDGKTVAWPVGIGGKGNEGVSGQVTQTQGAIGYVELQYALAQNLAYGQVKNSSGSFIQPCAATIEAATEGVTYPANLLTLITNASGANAYPIAGDTYALIYQKQTDKAKAAALLNFFSWVLSKGQDQVGSLGYVPLGQSIQQKAVAMLKTVTVNGQPLVK
jgi:phosphate transport system substrate-binding protein